MVAKREITADVREGRPVLSWRREKNANIGLTRPAVIDPCGVNCTVRSTNPDDWSVVVATSIDTVLFNSSEDANFVLSGFTVTGGAGGGGAGVTCSGTSPIVQWCIITDNDYYGLYCSGGSPEINNNKIHNNAVVGLMTVGASMATVKNNWIYENETGIRLAGGTNYTQIRNNTIVDNNDVGIDKAIQGPAASPTISNCILWNNVDELHSAFNSCIDPSSGDDAI